MDLWQLRIFCKVVEHKSFSHAARAIHLSQPTISSHIQALEQHFNCRLIDRLAKQALPTSAGDILYRYARRLLALRDETEAAMASHLGTVCGRLRIGASTIPGTYILPAIIGEFTRQHPKVNVSLQIGDSRQIIEGVLNSDLQLGIVGVESRDRNTAQEKLLEDEMRLIVPADHPWASRARVSIADLSQAPFVAREQGSGTLAALQASLQQAGSGLRQFNIVAEMGSTTAVIQGIKGGLGISILSPIAVAEELSRGALKALSVEGLRLKRFFFLTRLRQRSLSPLGQTFGQFLRTTLAAGSKRRQTLLEMNQPS